MRISDWSSDVCSSDLESVKARTGITIRTAEVDADHIDATAALIRETGATHVVNLALPYQDLTIMEACLSTGAHYLDTANYEPSHEAQFEYHWQWAYHYRFNAAGMMDQLGSGYVPCQRTIL